MNFLDGSGYKLRDLVAQAYERKPAERSKFDNDVIAVDERLNITYLCIPVSCCVSADPPIRITWHTPGSCFSINLRILPYQGSDAYYLMTFSR